jgi:hypothetical protein
LELWSRLRPRALFRGGGGRPSFMPFVFYCRSCGWGLRLELPCNAGPPNVRRRLFELLGTVIPKILNKISSRGIATGSSSIDRRHPSVIYVNVSKTNGTKANALSGETAVSAGANLNTMKNRYKIRI